MAEGDLDGARDALGERAIGPIRQALDRLVASHEERREVAQRALAGALRGIPEAVEAIAAEVDEEQEAIAALRAAADRAYASGRSSLGEELGRGTFMRAEVLRQWQDFIGAGQVARYLAEGIGKVIATVRSLLEPGPPAPAIEVREAAFADLIALSVQHADEAAQRTARAWSGDRYGALALGADEALWRASPDLPEAPRRRARGLRWAAEIGERIREMGQQRKGWAQAASLGVNVIGTSAVLAVFVHTGGLTGGGGRDHRGDRGREPEAARSDFRRGQRRRLRGAGAREAERAARHELRRRTTPMVGQAGSTGDPALAAELRESARQVRQLVAE